MALLTLALAGGVSLIAWKSMSPTAQWVTFTVVVSKIYDDVVFEGNDFGPGDLMISAAVSMAVMGAL